MDGWMDGWSDGGMEGGRDGLREADKYKGMEGNSEASRGHAGLQARKHAGQSSDYFAASFVNAKVCCAFQSSDTWNEVSRCGFLLP